MFGKLFRALEPYTGVIEWMVRAFVAIAGGVVTGWAAQATKALEAYEPLSYVLAGIVGAGIAVLIFAAWGWFRLAIARAHYLREISKPMDGVNPLEDNFYRKRIDVSKFGDPVGRASIKQDFRNCEIVGPAVVYFRNCTFTGIFEQGLCDFIGLRDDSRKPPLQNPIVFDNCIFRDCHYSRLVMLFNRNNSDQLDQVSNGQIPWLTKK